MNPRSNNCRTHLTPTIYNVHHMIVGLRCNSHSHTLTVSAAFDVLFGVLGWVSTCEEILNVAFGVISLPSRAY